MKKWTMIIKSHAEAPDFEAEVLAETEEEALVLFLEKYPALNDFDRLTLLGNIG